MEWVPIPEKLGVTETKIGGLIPIKMFMRMVFAFVMFVFIGILIPFRMGMQTSAKAGTALLTFIFFFVLIVGQKEGIPLLLYLAKIQRFKIRPNKYKKLAGEKAKYPPTQELIGVKEVSGRVVDMGAGTCVSMLKVTPIDLLLRTEGEGMMVYSGEGLCQNTINFTTQRIAKPRPYDCMPYIQPYLENLKKLPPNHELRRHIQKHIKAFVETIEDFKTLWYDFYFNISTNVRSTDPALAREEKSELKAAKTLEESEKIRAEYKKKRLEIAERDLAQKRKTFIAAMSRVDPDLEVTELEDDALVQAQRNCYSFVSYPKAEEVFKKCGILLEK